MFFDDPLRLVCKANLQQASLAICRDSNDGSFWILNDDVQNCELQARELFGFNIGSFQELPTGDLFNICFPSKKYGVTICHICFVWQCTIDFPCHTFHPIRRCSIGDRPAALAHPIWPGFGGVGVHWFWWEHQKGDHVHFGGVLLDHQDTWCYWSIDDGPQCISNAEGNWVDQSLHLNFMFSRVLKHHHGMTPFFRHGFEIAPCRQMAYHGHFGTPSNPRARWTCSNQNVLRPIWWQLALPNLGGASRTTTSWFSQPTLAHSGRHPLRIQSYPNVYKIHGFTICECCIMFSYSIGYFPVIGQSLFYPPWMDPAGQSARWSSCCDYPGETEVLFHQCHHYRCQISDQASVIHGWTRHPSVFGEQPSLGSVPLA